MKYNYLLRYCNMVVGLHNNNVEMYNVEIRVKYMQNTVTFETETPTKVNCNFNTV